MIKPLPVDETDRQKRLDKAIQKVNDEITLAIADNRTECTFPISNDEPLYKEVKKAFLEAGYEIFVNIYARCGGVVEHISW